ncbi:MAG TPA: NfeD family protein [Candidatus Methanoperedenaceae archaeon]|nr:NfeD family protein [Candidatus Methanoperedenaceae archaeon]
MELGWLMLIAGIILLLIEVAQPGFFVAVPGTILVVMGATLLLIPDVYEAWAPAILVVSAVLSSLATILIYRLIAPGQKPLATSKDTLIGKKGVVTAAIRPGELTGKVRIDNQMWSATSDSVIQAGKPVVVESSEGVHVKVKEV